MTDDRSPDRRPPASREGDFSLVELNSFPQHVDRVVDWIVAEWNSEPEEVRFRLLKPPSSPPTRVAVADNSPIGVVNFRRYPFADDDDALWINVLFVIEAMRGRGIGGRLLQDAVESAARLSRKRLFVYTDLPGFYTRRGWRVLQVNEDGMNVLDTTPRTLSDAGK